MGFLSGAYGKIMAGKRMRSIQHRLDSISSQHRRITKEIDLKTKMYTQQERNMKNMMQMQMNQSIMSGLGAAAMGAGNADLANSLNMYANMFDSAMGGGNMMGIMQATMPTVGANGLTTSGFNIQATNIYSMIQQAAQMQFAQSNTMWSNMFEMQKEADLQALKDIEDELQTEKESLESQLKLATAEYDAKKEEEKAGVKNITPDYTGQA